MMDVLCRSGAKGGIWNRQPNYSLRSRGLFIEVLKQTRKKSFDPNADMGGVDQQGAAAPAGALAEHIA